MSKNSNITNSHLTKFKEWFGWEPGADGIIKDYRLGVMTEEPSFMLYTPLHEHTVLDACLVSVSVFQGSDKEWFMEYCFVIPEKFHEDWREYIKNSPSNSNRTTTKGE